MREAKVLVLHRQSVPVHIARATPTPIDLQRDKRGRQLSADRKRVDGPRGCSLILDPDELGDGGFELIRLPAPRGCQEPHQFRLVG